MTRLEKAQNTLKEELAKINESEITYANPRLAIKSEILSDIFYDVFECKPTKQELKWLDDEDREYQTWLATEFF